MDDQAQTSTAEASLSDSEWMRLGHPSMSEGAKKRLIEKRIEETTWSFSHILSCKPCARKEPRPKKIAQRNSEEEENQEDMQSQSESVAGDILPIEFDDRRTSKHSNYPSDQFEWAVLYENQRGFLAFSTPYYSSRSLLPRDPPAFTSPNTESGVPSPYPTSRNITLETYPLPDPTWRWVSPTWFVDMRGNGEVQHDGFEYNWYFRRSNWRSKVGWFSAGGFVRRRRWIRLMVRPSDGHLEAEATERERDLDDKANDSLMSTFHPDDFPIWRGDEHDWHRLRKVSRIVVGDEPKLQLWKAWLADIITDQKQLKNKSREILEDDVVVVMNDNLQMMDERPNREWVLSLLKEHANDFRYVFIFPDAQQCFGELLLTAGLSHELFPAGGLPHELLPEAQACVAVLPSVYGEISPHVFLEYRTPSMTDDQSEVGEAVCSL